MSGFGEKKSTFRRGGSVLGEVFVVLTAVSREKFSEKGQRCEEESLLGSGNSTCKGPGIGAGQQCLQHSREDRLG